MFIQAQMLEHHVLVFLIELHNNNKPDKINTMDGHNYLLVIKFTKGNGLLVLV